MIKELEKRIEGRFTVLEEVLECQIKSLNEAVSVMNEIHYLLYLKDKIANNDDAE